MAYSYSSGGDGGGSSGGKTPFALMAAGTATQIIGQYQSNMDMATAEMQNANFYSQEAGYARLASLREAHLTAQKYDYTLSLQGSAAAKGGVDLSGSIANTMASTVAQKISELTAIKQKGDLDVELAQARGLRAQQQADTLSSGVYNALEVGKTVLTAAALFV